MFQICEPNQPEISSHRQISPISECKNGKSRSEKQLLTKGLDNPKRTSIFAKLSELKGSKELESANMREQSQSPEDIDYITFSKIGEIPSIIEQEVDYDNQKYPNSTFNELFEI